MYAMKCVTLHLLLSTILQHSAAGMHQPHLAQPQFANQSYAMSVEPDATTAQEEPFSLMQVDLQLEIPDRSNAAKVHRHHVAQGTRHHHTRHNIKRPRAEVPQDESIRDKEAGALLVATAAEARSVGRFRTGHRVQMNAYTVVIVILSVCILCALCSLVSSAFTSQRGRSDDRWGFTQAHRGYERQASPLSTGSAGGLLMSPSPSNPRLMQGSPPSSSNMPMPDMRLALPTPLSSPHGQGARYRIDGVWTPWEGGNRAQIHNVTSDTEVACLHWSETEYGSGILFVLSPKSPIAWLDTEQLRTRGMQEVTVFGASDENWSAMASPAAVVKQLPGDSGFIMKMGQQDLLTIRMNQQKKLTSVEKDGKAIAQFQEGFGPGYELHIDGGADAGLVLVATVSCLQMMTHPKKSRPGGTSAAI